MNNPIKKDGSQLNNPSGFKFTLSPSSVRLDWFSEFTQQLVPVFSPTPSFFQDRVGYTLFSYGNKSNRRETKWQH